jgi:hypothetical protein
MRVGGIIAIVVAVILVALLIVMALVLPRQRGYTVEGNVVVRCRQGHLFTTLWVPGASLKAVRLVAARWQHCPVGHHWSLVVPVREADLSPDQLSQARAVHDARIP